MFKISVTTIDQFAKYLLKEEMTDEELITRLTTEFTQTKYTELGTGFHDVLQNPLKRHKFFNNNGNIEAYYEALNGIQFSEKLIHDCQKKIKWDVPAFEVPISKIYSTNYGDVKVVGRADQLYLNSVQEIKSCWTQYKYDNYKDSIQWKFYIDMFEVKSCRYIVFQMNDGMEISLGNIHEFEFFPYPNLEQDLHNILNSFLDFLHNKEIQNHFQI